MSPLRHSVISIYAFNQSYIAFLIGCWLPRVTWHVRAVRWESSYFTHFKRHPGVKQSRLHLIRQHSPTFHSVIYNGFWTVLLNAAFFTDLHTSLSKTKKYPGLAGAPPILFTSPSNVSYVCWWQSNNTDIYEHVEASCWRWANNGRQFCAFSNTYTHSHSNSRLQSHAADGKYTLPAKECSEVLTWN